MADVALVTLKNTLESLQTRDTKKLSKWQRYEDHLDAMQKEIIRYLTRIYQEDVSEVEAKELSSMIRVTNNIERIGDAVENLAEMTEDIIDKDINFSKDALKDIQVISNQAVAFLMLVQEGMQSTTANFMSDAQTIEDNIDFMRDEMRNDHIFRLKEGVCRNEPGLIFSDILSNFEKIGDYCYNIAQGIAGIK
jgi:phosphate:Na+ symporter